MEIEYRAKADWHNYHLTRAYPVAEVGYVRNSIAASGSDWKARLATTAALLRGHVAHAMATNGWVMPVGALWSFSHIAGDSRLQLRCASGEGDDPQQGDGVTGCFTLAASDLAAAPVADGGATVMVLGGTTLRQLADWAEPQGWSLRTSGTQLGPTVGGGIATGTHGSRLNFGGVQNQVVGLHLITGPESSVWIERASHPVLTDAAAQAIDNAVRIVRDDAMFADALVHLGGMGIVNAAAVQLGPNDTYDVVRKKAPLTDALLAALAIGDFRSVARSLGEDREPCFYELSLHPQFDNASPRNALHTFYFVSNSPASADAEGLSLPHAGESITKFVQHIEMLKITEMKGGVSISSIIDQFDALASYESFFDRDASVIWVVKPSWRLVHASDLPTGGIAGALHNGSFAIDRALIPIIIPLLRASVLGLKPHFLFTMRFVSHADGTMAFTRFPHCAVIEVDGLSQTGYRTIFNGVPGNEDYPVQAELAIKRVRAMFGDLIPYSMHWGKLGWEGDSAKVEADFGPSSDPSSPLSRWRRTRQFLLGSSSSVFLNHALVDFGIVRD